MRSPARISPILDLFERIWLNCPDQRFGQLVENMGINFNTEDLNEAIIKMCEFA